MKKLFIFLVIFFVMTSCATLPPLKTASGKPEITICGVDKSEFMEKVVAATSMKGLNIRSSSNYQIVTSQPVNDALLKALYSSKYDSDPEWRYIYTFADMGNQCTFISARIQIITNPGSGFEKITDVSSGKAAHNLQAEFEDLKSQVEAKRGR